VRAESSPLERQTVRTLESATQAGGEIVAGERATDLFIYPPYHFRVVDVLLTNFHLPHSTLLMLVSAFAGREFLLRAYEEALRERYRFYSYGDCMPDRVMKVLAACRRERFVASATTASVRP